VAPAILLYSSALHQLGKFGWLVAFIYTASVALRLARFNTQLATADKRYFQGLSSPIGAATVASFVWLCQQNEWNNRFVVLAMAGMALLAAVLMVSNIRYHSFKELDFKGKVPFLYVLILVLLFAAVAWAPALVIWLTSISYIASGPLQTLMTIQRVRKQRRRRIKLRRIKKS